MINYKGFEIVKTGRSFQDYHVNLGNRPRWGTLEELKKDIDDHVNGNLVKFEPNY